MGLRTDARLDLNYVLLDAAALRDVTALQFVSTLWAAAVCSVSTVGSCPERSGLPSLYLRLWRLPLRWGPSQEHGLTRSGAAMYPPWHGARIAFADSKGPNFFPFHLSLLSPCYLERGFSVDWFVGLFPSCSPPTVNF